MQGNDYERLLASVDRAIAVLEEQRLRLGFDAELYERLQEIRACVVTAHAAATKGEADC